MVYDTSGTIRHHTDCAPYLRPYQSYYEYRSIEPYHNHWKTRRYGIVGVENTMMLVSIAMVCIADVYDKDTMVSQWTNE